MNHFLNSDCMLYLPTYPDGFFDLAIVDPPYGINIGHRVTAGGNTPFDHDKGLKRPFGGITVMGGGGYSGKWRTDTGQSKKLEVQSKFYIAFDDSSPPDARYFRELLRVSKQAIIWGGNFFLDHLGACSRMIVWDKKRRGLSQADCEIAWTNLKGQNRIFEWKWNGMLQEDMRHKEKRVHATQKPVALYKYLLETYAKEGDRILDTHVGSASSLIACEQLGFEYTGFEINKDIYDIAVQRMEEYRLTGVQQEMKL